MSIYLNYIRDFLQNYKDNKIPKFKEQYNYKVKNLKGGFIPANLQTLLNNISNFIGQNVDERLGDKEKKIGELIKEIDLMIKTGEGLSLENNRIILNNLKIIAQSLDDSRNLADEKGAEIKPREQDLKLLPTSVFTFNYQESSIFRSNLENLKQQLNTTADPVQQTKNKQAIEKFIKELEAELSKIKQDNVKILALIEKYRQHVDLDGKEIENIKRDNKEIINKKINKQEIKLLNEIEFIEKVINIIPETIKNIGEYRNLAANPNREKLITRFIREYNDIYWKYIPIPEEGKEEDLLPEKIYNDSKTERMLNNYLDVQKQEGLKNILGGLKQNIQNIPKMYKTVNGKLEQVEQFDFNKLTTGMKDLTKIKSQEKPIVGGNINIKDRIYEKIRSGQFGIYMPNNNLIGGIGGEGENKYDEPEIDSELFNRANEKLLEYTEVENELKQNIEKLNVYQLYFTIYLCNMVLMNGTLLSVIYDNSYTLYTYIGKGVLEYYKRIIYNIIARIISGDTTDYIEYFRQYHIVALYELYGFLLYVTEEFYTKDNIKQIIMISQCSDNVKYYFNLLNFYKSLLENFNETAMNKISVFARINDMPSKSDNLGRDNTLFVSDANTNKVRLVENVCEALQNQKLDEFTFTEVFDSDKFQSNNDIALYMAIPSQLAKGKSVSILTFGYSGTGKTFTLFGSNGANKDGLLQAILNKIDNLTQLRLRIFELYGLETSAIEFKDINKYFNGMLDTSLYSFKITDEKVPGKITFDEVSKINKNIKTEFIDKQDNYLVVGVENIENVFSTFSELTEAIDKNRKGEDNLVPIINNMPEIPRIQRIRPTPNNPESSRSILVYDFKLTVKGLEKEKEVNFLVIDMPGREDIEVTFIDKYTSSEVNSIGSQIMKKQIKIDNQAIEDKIKNPKEGQTIPEVSYSFASGDNLNENYMSFLRLILLCMSFCPILLPSIDYINNFAFQCFIDKYEKFANKDDLLNLIGITEFKKYINLYIAEKNSNYNAKNILIDFNKIVNAKEYQKTIAEKYIKYLLLTKNITDIYIIYKRLCDNYINNVIMNFLFDGKNNKVKLIELINNLKQANFKKEDLAKFVEDADNYNLQKYKDELFKILKYDFYINPFEGIAINSNIMILINYIASYMISEDKKAMADQFINKTISVNEELKLEDNRLSLGNKSINIEQYYVLTEEGMIENTKKYLDVYEGIKIDYKSEHGIDLSNYANLGFYGVYNSITMNSQFGNNPNKDLRSILLHRFVNRYWFGKGRLIDKNKLDTLYNELKSMYKINGLKEEFFVSKSEEKKDLESQPIVTQSLDSYIENINTWNMFYLFANYKNNKEKTELKCRQQYELAQDTKSLVELTQLVK